MPSTLTEVSVRTRVARRLAETVGAHKFKLWFDRSARMDFNEGQRRFDVAVPNRFVADWIGRNFQAQLDAAVSEELGPDIPVHIHIDPSRFADLPPAAAPSRPKPAPARGHAHASPAASRYTLPLRHTLDDFIVGPCNELAYAAVTRLANHDPHDHSGSPLFIHGGCGLGKTHLLQGLCAAVRKARPDAAVHYTTGEQFTNDFLAAVRSNTLDQFRRRVRRLDLLAVDDVHFIADKEKTQQEFLHSFNAIDLAGARIVMASDCHPKLIRQFSEALISRCVRGMVVEVRPPDRAMRIKILRALAHKRGLSLLDTVVEVIASRATGSFRELEGTLAKLHALTTLTRRDGQTEEAVGHTLLARLYESSSDRPRRTLGVDDVLGAVCNHLGISRQQVLGSSRHRLVVLARTMAIHLARQHTSMSYPELAAALGRSSHSTVIAAANRFERTLAAGETVALPGHDSPVPVAQIVEDVKRKLAA